MVFKAGQYSDQKISSEDQNKGKRKDKQLWATVAKLILFLFTVNNFFYRYVRKPASREAFFIMLDPQCS